VHGQHREKRLLRGEGFICPPRDVTERGSVARAERLLLSPGMQRGGASCSLLPLDDKRDRPPTRLLLLVHLRNQNCSRIVPRWRLLSRRARLQCCGAAEGTVRERSSPSALYLWLGNDENCRSDRFSDAANYWFWHVFSIFARRLCAKRQGERTRLLCRFISKAARSS